MHIKKREKQNTGFLHFCLICHLQLLGCLHEVTETTDTVKTSRWCFTNNQWLSYRFTLMQLQITQNESLFRNRNLTSLNNYNSYQNTARSHLSLGTLPSWQWSYWHANSTHQQPTPTRTKPVCIKKTKQNKKTRRFYYFIMNMKCCPTTLFKFYILALLCFWVWHSCSRQYV